MRRRMTGQERNAEMKMEKGKEEKRIQKEGEGGENMCEHEERSNHVCPVEVTTGLQVLIMC